MTYLQGKHNNMMICLLLLMAAIFSSIPGQPLFAAEPPILYLFWGQNCPECEAEKEFVQALQNTYPQVELRWFELGTRPEFLEIAKLLAQTHQIEASRVPLTFVGSWGQVGFDDTTGAQIEEQVQRCLQQGCPDVLSISGPYRVALNIRNEADLNIPAGWERFPPVSPLSEAAQTAQRTEKLIVYYLHGKARCVACGIIEQYTREIVRDAFAQELKTGQVELQVVNVETPETRHLIKDYQIYSQSVVLSDVHADQEVRWKNLPRIWELLNNETAFKQYLQTEITAYLQEDHS